MAQPKQDYGIEIVRKCKLDFPKVYDFSTLDALEQYFTQQTPRNVPYRVWKLRFSKVCYAAIRMGTLKLSAKEVKTYLFNLIVWGDVSCAEVQNNGTCDPIHPIFARAGIDTQEENLRRLIREAYADKVNTKREMFAQQEDLHLIAHFTKFQEDNHIGLAVVFSPLEVEANVTVLDIIHFKDDSPEACVWKSKMAGILANFDLTRKKFATATAFAYNDKNPTEFEVFNELCKQLSKVCGKIVCGSFHSEKIIDDVVEKMEIGVDYLEDCQQQLIEAVLESDDDAMPELVKEILYFRTNKVQDFCT